MRVLRAGDYTKMPWKNGGGVTTEVAIFPTAAGLADFHWRVSMATVAEDGPFSVFAEIDRTLSIIDGAGMELSVAENAPVLLDQQSDPFAFDGGAATSAVLTAGPIVDLNVMTRRGRTTASVRRVQAGEALRFDGPCSLLLCHHSNLSFDENGTVHRLGPLDSLLHHDLQPIAGMLVGEGTAFLIGFAPA